MSRRGKSTAGRGRPRPSEKSLPLLFRISGCRRNRGWGVGWPSPKRSAGASLECFGEGHPTLYLESTGMRLDALAAEVSGARVVGDGSVDVESLAYDSRKVGPGTLFFCVPGEKVDGH